MASIFDHQSEITPKERIISKFSEWWSDNEIRKKIIPEIVPKKIKASIDGELQNFQKIEKNKKTFSEILFDLVGQNFLVNHNKELRTKFLVFILKKYAQGNSYFHEQFLGYLRIEEKSTQIGKCKKCNKEYFEEDEIFFQSLGLDTEIKCRDIECVITQQKKLIPNIGDSLFFNFIYKFNLKGNYKYFCNKLIQELNLPPEVLQMTQSEIKLLPEIIRPLGNFPVLHNYQASIGLMIRDMLENYSKNTSRGLVVLPTGAGKTRLVVETLVNWLNSNKKGIEKSKFIVWIVDKNELCQQAFDTFADVFRHRGKRDSSLRLHPIYGEHTKNIRDILFSYSMDNEGEINEENGVIIASISSLHYMTKQNDKGSLPELAKSTSIVIIDEAHHAAPRNSSYNDVLEVFGFDFMKGKKEEEEDFNKYKIRLLGLTATPFRGNDEDKQSTKALLNRFGKQERILWPPFEDNVEKQNIPPFAHVEIQNTAYQSEKVKIYGDKSYDKDGIIVKYNFIIEKLSSATTFTESPVIHNEEYSEKNIDFVFQEPGRYKVTLIVEDDEGVKNENFTLANIEILPKSKKTEKSNFEEMKRMYKHLIKRKILAKPHHYVIDNLAGEYNATKDKKRIVGFRDFSNETINGIGNDSSRNHKIIKKIISLVEKENKKAILLFACSIEHSKLISFILDAIHGIKSASIDHKTSVDERDQIIGDFRNGKTKVLCNYNLLTTGFDYPKVDCIFITRPTFSHVIYNQMLGRGLRGLRSYGTEDCSIVEFSDNIITGITEDENEEPSKLFDYIYDTVYEQRLESEQDQICYCCFGKKQIKYKGELEKCRICNGEGKIFQRKLKSNEGSIKTYDSEQLQRIVREMGITHPNMSLKERATHAKSQLDLKRILEEKKQKIATKGEWAACCKICRDSSSEMPYTIAHFQRHDYLKTKTNPFGISDVCKNCSEKFDKAECSKCGKTTNALNKSKNYLDLE